MEMKAKCQFNSDKTKKALQTFIDQQVQYVLSITIVIQIEKKTILTTTFDVGELI